MIRFGAQPSLLDLIPSDEPERFHIVMPSMALACGADILAPHNRSVFNWSTAEGYARVTCPECRALNQWALQDEAKRQQGQQ